MYVPRVLTSPCLSAARSSEATSRWNSSSAERRRGSGETVTVDWPQEAGDSDGTRCPGQGRSDFEAPQLASRSASERRSPAVVEQARRVFSSYVVRGICSSSPDCICDSHREPELPELDGERTTLRRGFVGCACTSPKPAPGAFAASPRWPQNWWQWRRLNPAVRAIAFGSSVWTRVGSARRTPPTERLRRGDDRQMTCLGLLDALELPHAHLIGPTSVGTSASSSASRRRNAVERFMSLNTGHPFVRPTPPALATPWRFWYWPVLGAPLLVPVRSRRRASSRCSAAGSPPIEPAEALRTRRSTWPVWRSQRRALAAARPVAAYLLKTRRRCCGRVTGRKGCGIPTKMLHGLEDHVLRPRSLPATSPCRRYDDRAGSRSVTSSPRRRRGWWRGGRLIFSMPDSPTGLTRAPEVRSMARVLVQKGRESIREAEMQSWDLEERRSGAAPAADPRLGGGCADDLLQLPAGEALQEPRCASGRGW